MKDIDKLVDLYYIEKKLNCDRTMLKCLGELFDLEISDQVMAAAVGQHTAGIRKQCGFVEGTLMFIGIYFSQRGATDKEISALCRKYIDSYQEVFVYTQCEDIREKILMLKDDKHGQCGPMGERTVRHSYEFIKGQQ